MAVLVVIVAFSLALTVSQLDKFVVRNQPLAILPPLAVLIKMVELPANGGYMPSKTAHSRALCGIKIATLLQFRIGSILSDMN